MDRKICEENIAKFYGGDWFNEFNRHRTSVFEFLYKSLARKRFTKFTLIAERSRAVAEAVEA